MIIIVLLGPPLPPSLPWIGSAVGGAEHRAGRGKVTAAEKRLDLNICFAALETHGTVRVVKNLYRRMRLPVVVVVVERDRSRNPPPATEEQEVRKVREGGSSWGEQSVDRVRVEGLC